MPYEGFIRSALLSMEQIDVYVDNMYTIIVQPEKSYREISRVIDQLEVQDWEIQDFKMEYPFIELEYIHSMYVYKLLADKPKTSGKAILFPFNLGLYKAIYDALPTSIDKTRLKLRKITGRRFYPFVFIYMGDQHHAILKQAHQTRRLKSSYTKENIGKVIAKDHSKLIEDSKSFGEMLSLIGTDVRMCEIQHLISTSPGSSHIKKLNTVMYKHGYDKTHDLLNMLGYRRPGNQPIENHETYISNLTKMCFKFNKSPMSYTMDGVQFKIYQTKSRVCVIYEIYFIKSVRLESDDPNDMDILYSVLHSIDKLDIFYQKIEAEALMNI